MGDTLSFSLGGSFGVAQDRRRPLLQQKPTPPIEQAAASVYGLYHLEINSCGHRTYHNTVIVKRLREAMLIRISLTIKDTGGV